MPQFRVWVHDERLVMYFVEAEDEDDAQFRVEAASNVEEEFRYQVVEAKWYVDNVEAV